MTNIIIKKWIEPYVLLETAKQHFEMKDYTFDGFSKNTVRAEFLKALEKSDTFGLYMKNVNKFYLFSGSEKINLKELYNFSDEDFELIDDMDEPFNLVDMGKAEAGIIQVLAPD